MFLVIRNHFMAMLRDCANILPQRHRGTEKFLESLIQKKLLIFVIQVNNIQLQLAYLLQLFLAFLYMMHMNKIGTIP